MKTVADTSALIALLYPDDEHNERASKALGEARNDGAVVVSPVTYAELAVDSTFRHADEVDAFFDDTGVRVEEVEHETLFLAGEKFQEYLGERGDTLQCPECGEKTIFNCPSCGNEITAIQHLPSDFVIGAHAERQADALVTFDTGFFETYFDVETHFA